MPIFPNMSELTLATPVGTEEIQISATQRTTLNRIAALFKDLGLTGFDNTVETNVINNAVSSSDTLLEALQKIFARLGKSSVAIYPYSTATVKAIVGLYGSVQFGFKVEGSSLYFGLNSNFEPSGENTTIVGMYTAITNWTQLGNGDQLLDLSSPEEFWLNPGRQVAIQSAPGGRSIMLSTSQWATNSNKLLSASVLSTVNITRNMFGTGGTGELTFIFSKDFDEDPGTPYQIVAAQEYILNGSRVIAFNKAGYIGSN